MSEPLKPSPPPQELPEGEGGFVRVLVKLVRTRIISGLFVALPIALTLFIVHYLYATTVLLLTPVVVTVRLVAGRLAGDPDYFDNTFWSRYLAPVIAVVLVLSALYALGMFVRSRVLRAVDWVFLHVPVVGTIFKAVKNVFQSLGQQLEGNLGFKRIVLVEFPHPGMKSLAFVTSTLHDATTGRTILCVCLLTGVMPPAGFTLFVPEEAVTDVDWSMNQALQVILSGGITSPSAIHYYQGLQVPPNGPILDPHGDPIASSGPEAKPLAE
jgi:uncharacterized membrane protein